MTSFDLGPAAERIGLLADGVREDQFDRPTPNPDWPVAVLLNHLTTLAGAFADGARKVPRHDTPEPVAELPAAGGTSCGRTWTTWSRRGGTRRRGRVRPPSAG